MSFDRPTRNALARMVGQARERLRVDVMDQLRRLGFQADGTVLDLDRIAGLSDGERAAALELRALLDHFVALESGPEAACRQAAYDRLVHEIGFTTFNRLAALRVAEERGLIVQSVGRGLASDGFQIYERVANGALGSRVETYRAYLECLYDELAQDLPLLFDRGAPESSIFPGERCLEDVLGLLNDPNLAHLWREDEAIGWVYQYYNDPDERRRMREASYAPRTSRELAVRNQFFTPRYVVEFLTDNTLGRMWYEMRQGNSRLKEQCRYLVIRPNEIFLRRGEQLPATDEPAGNLNREELLRSPVYVPYRAKKDPRDLKVLDPACGSGHFLLYAFDLLETIYEETWADPDSPPFEATGRTLRQDYPDLDRLRCQVPGLILRHNLHGVDIDPRACQIAALSLWLRAQRSFQRLGLRPSERPPLTKGNIVVAEPMPGERDLLEQFVARLDPPLVGSLVRQVFDTLQLAGEAGLLLKLDEELRDAIHSARALWQRAPRPQQLALLPELERQRAKQLELFDVSGITDETFWVQVEDHIREALAEYAESTSNGQATGKRLFAEDTERGFALVELSQKRFDVVLMNPPFGDFSKGFAARARISYPHTYNDIFAAFVERTLDLLQRGGLLGAITSRAGFFLGSFAAWREKVVLEKGVLRCLADLGSGVMDDAMVEAAAYCVEKRPGAPAKPAVFRVLGMADRDTALLRAIERLQEGVADPVIFQPRLGQFSVLPDFPFVYWIEEAVVRQLADLPAFEPTVGSVRQGLATGDNVRFVRAIWEVPARSRILPRSDRSADADSCTHRWAPLIMAGASQPWFAPITVVVNWGKDGAELKNFVDERGKLKSRPQNAQFYFRPGFSWTRRAVRLIPYAIPAGCIPSASRYMAFPHPGQEFAALGVAASNVASAYMRCYGEKFEWPNFLVQTMKSLPWPRLPDSLMATLEQVAEREVERRRRAYQNHEPFLEFTVPSACSPHLMADPLAFDRRSLLGNELDEAIAGAYGLSRHELTAVTRDLQEAVAVALQTKRDQDVSEGQSTNENEGEDENEGQDFVITDTPRDRQEALLSYAVGIALGRWDVRLALDPSLAPRLPGPFDPLPVCSPGMLVGPDGLPAEPGRIASEEWLRARPNAITLPPEGSVPRPTIADEEYPLRISWNGILVEDPRHPDDIVCRVQEVLALLGPDRAEPIEQEACEILGVSSLCDYFRRPAGFFADHLRRYSKSRRQAPIYWPLSTASGSYTLWVYYHRLTSDTLYNAVNRYVEPKIASVERELREAEGKLAAASGRIATRLREQVESSRAFLNELRDFRDELLRVAALPYQPNLDDGVIINAAPLHKLFRLPKWARDTKETWARLERGDYDWARLAYTIWPERVREKCRSDRSLAIAHNLENLYIAPRTTSRQARRRPARAGVER